MPQAFVIIQIGNNELDEVCAKAIFPAIQACGLDPRRVDQHNEGGLLKSEIVRFIQDSDILIADLTNERPNVYLEVGYAMGLDKFRNLILTVREDHFVDSANHQRGGPRVHFDLFGYDILQWTMTDLDAFRNELGQRIERRLAILQRASPATIWKPDWVDTRRAEAVEGLKTLKGNGFMEVRAAVHPPKPTKDQVELRDAARNAQIEVDWPIAPYFDVEGLRPKPTADGIVASILPESKESFDYWSIGRNGDFYFLRSLLEDRWPPGAAGKFIYSDTRIIRVTEAVLYCIRLYTALGVDRSSRVSIVVRHGGLRGRVLSSLVPVSYGLIRQKLVSEEDTVEVEAVGSLDECEARLVDKVIGLLDPLFTVFDFTKFERSTYEQTVNKFVSEVATAL